MEGLQAKDITPCARCKGPLVSPGTGVIHFYRVTISTYIPDQKALQERAGLQLLWGNAPGSAALADVFAPSRCVAHSLGGRTVNLCLDCAARSEILAYVEVSEKDIEESDAREVESGS